MATDILFIVNPASAHGRTRRRWRSYEATFREVIGSGFEALETERPGHAATLATTAILRGATTIVAVGGDGTLNEVVNGFLDRSGHPWNPKARLAVLPSGTGTDFSKTFPVPRTRHAFAEMLRDGEARSIDIGLCEFLLDGVSARRYFINVAEFGSGGAVVDRVNRSWKILGGRLTFLLAILRTLPKYRNTTVSYTVDGGPPRRVIVNDFVVANGRYFGAGLQPAPSADLSDGLFDVVIFGDIDFKTARRNLPALRRGEHLSMPEVTSFRCRELRIESNDEIIDLDGESVGRHPVRFRVLPKAIPVLGTKGG